MTPHRDIDRVLDAWLDEGPVVFPDRALHAALETVERTRQQSAAPAVWRYLSMVALTPRRLGLPVAVVGAIAVLVVTASAIALLQSNIAGPRMGSAPETTLTVEEVRGAVLAETEAPPGTTFQRSGIVNLAYIAPDPALRKEWAALGLRSDDTWHSFFSGSGRTWVTAGMVWADAASAEAALDAHRAMLPIVLQGEKDLAVTGLGDDGSCYSFVDNSIMSGEGAACLFRIGNATFFVPASGAGVAGSEVIAVSRTVADAAR